MSENFEEVKREKVRVVPLKYVDDFPDHPFRVHDDESMADLVHSIEMNGVMNPVIARRKEDGRYELISGHRRKFACEKLGLELIPICVSRTRCKHGADDLFRKGFLCFEKRFLTEFLCGLYGSDRRSLHRGKASCDRIRIQRISAYHRAERADAALISIGRDHGCGIQSIPRQSHRSGTHGARV